MLPLEAHFVPPNPYSTTNSQAAAEKAMQAALTGKAGVPDESIRRPL
jgi:hypothetical protein